MSEPCLELVVFKVKDAARARIARRAAQEVVKHYEGFLSWSALEASVETNLFADIVLWRDLDCAKAAAAHISKDPGFSALMAEIDGLLTMAHFETDRTVEASAWAA